MSATESAAGVAQATPESPKSKLKTNIKRTSRQPFLKSERIIG